ncbi:hypothetical protein CBOM_02561 [Ceraceosorus bombacis]|uniref:Uncharacterized protein n=1 Tax=Ceraceosorus bombacis TaxID=401625 RepID=A0A0N7L9U2_9BASI|nr:hypothetical protein CBOM_02561 [Ceraceosorus bombacis]
MQEREDYVSLWRHVGFYVGIEPELLRRCFGTVSKAERCFYYIASHHFLHVAPLRDLPPPPPLSKTGGAVPQEGFKGPALPLLYSTSNRAPSNMSFASHLALHATAEKAQQEIVLDQAAGEKMRDEYHSLMAEMGIVLLMTCLSSLLLVFFIARHGLIRMWA